MATIHGLAAFAQSGLAGLQATQRDWSPFVGHFTSWAAMTPLRAAIRNDVGAAEIATALQSADAASAEIARLIAASGRLLSRSPSAKDGILQCVCFSECSLPGLLGHCERYGRFGWIFRKDAIYRAGGRPCVYLSDEMYTLLAQQGRAGDGSGDPAGPWQRLFGLANVYRPPGAGQVQDFTHEREWRLFGDLDLDTVAPELLIAPAAFEREMRALNPEVPVLPIDVLHEWGL
ncbi:MAG: hypothetical protein KDE27_28615 [Planctomycetes bacterium]|nr:hypothetical protein [Planctomycetota bacterium]